MTSTDTVISIFLFSVQILAIGKGGAVGEGSEDISQSDFTDNKASVLILDNDSPTILDGSTTFYAQLILPTGEVADDNNYKYVWKQTTPSKRKKTQFANDVTNLTEKYEDRKFDIGIHQMKVDVFKVWQPFNKLAHAETWFEITEYINGWLAANQINVTSSNQWTFATNEEIEFYADIYDPSQYFRNANMSFTWNFGNKFSKHTSQAHTVYRYGKADMYTVNVNISAMVPNQDYGSFSVKTGEFRQPIKLMDAVSNFTILGSSAVTMGQRSNYTITCNGSLPVTLCWYLDSYGGCEVGYNDSNSDICEELVLYDGCHSNIELDFNSTGQHCFGVWAHNTVSLELTALEISVKSPPAPPLPAVTASVTSLVILTTLGGIFVAVFVSHQIVRARKAQSIEVADFDFRRASYRSNLPSVIGIVPSTSEIKTYNKPEKKPLLNKSSSAWKSYAL